MSEDQRLQVHRNLKVYQLAYKLAMLGSMMSTPKKFMPRAQRRE
jgi:hypothetical protein